MTTIAVTSVKGSPGVTTTALALANTWARKEPALLAEVDCDGGDLAALCNLSLDGKGLFSLSIAARRDDSIVNAAEHCQKFGSSHLPVLVASPNPAKVIKSVETLGTRLLSCLNTTEHTIFLDAGRIRADSPTTSLLTRVDRILLIARPTLTQATAIQSRLETLQAMGPAVDLILIGERPYSASEFAEATGLAVRGVFPVDKRGAEAFISAPDSMFTRRSLLMRSAQKTADDLYARITQNSEIAL